MAQISPAKLSKVTMEEEVVSGFHNILITHDTIVILYEEALSQKQLSSVWSVIYLKPKENLMLQLRASFP